MTLSAKNAVAAKVRTALGLEESGQNAALNGDGHAIYFKKFYSDKGCDGASLCSRAPHRLDNLPGALSA